MTPLWIAVAVAVAVIVLGWLGIVGLIILVVLDFLRDRKTSGETLWLTATEKDPVRGYELAKAIRRYEAGARG